jgi:hypothetical protein
MIHYLLFELNYDPFCLTDWSNAFNIPPQHKMLHDADKAAAVAEEDPELELLQKVRRRFC